MTKPNENLNHTEIAQAAAKQMTENKGPGQRYGNKNGLTIVKIVNPTAPSKIHKLS